MICIQRRYPKSETLPLIQGGQTGLTTGIKAITVTRYLASVTAVIANLIEPMFYVEASVPEIAVIGAGSFTSMVFSCFHLYSDFEFRIPPSHKFMKTIVGVSEIACGMFACSQGMLATGISLLGAGGLAVLREIVLVANPRRDEEVR